MSSRFKQCSNNVPSGRIAFGGTTGQITFHFPFTEFIPPEQTIQFTAKVGSNEVIL